MLFENFCFSDSLVSGSKKARFKSWFYYLLALKPSAIYLTSLGLNFSICIMGIIIGLFLQKSSCDLRQLPEPL